MTFRCLRSHLARFLTGALAAVVILLAAMPQIASAQSIPGLTGGSGTAAEGEANADAAQPSMDELIKILENDETRKKLVESLKAAAYRAPAGDGSQAAAASPDEPGEIVRSLPGRVAEYTRMFIGAIAAVYVGIGLIGPTARRVEAAPLACL